MIYLGDLIAAGAQAIGSQMAGRTEEIVGEPDVVAAASAALLGMFLTCWMPRRDDVRVQLFG